MASVQLERMAFWLETPLFPLAKGAGYPCFGPKMLVSRDAGDPVQNCLHVI